MQPTDRRILELDALRGLAALAVVLYHFTTRYEQLYGHVATLPASFAWGEYGVDFFLMLSGFVIFRSLDRTRHARDFIISRFMRLYPAYWAAAVLTYGAVCLFGLPGQQVAPWEAALNATMLQQVLGARHIDGAYWSLQVELFFYAGMLVLHRAGAFRDARRLHVTLALWLLLAAAAWTLNLGGEGVDRTIVSRVVSKLQVLLSLRYGHLFIIGIVLYHVGRRGRSRPADWLLLAGCCGIQGLVDSWAAAWLTGMLTAVLYGAVRQRLRWLTAPPLVLLGSTSYCLYLIHQNAGYILIHELERRAVPPAAAIAITVVASLALAGALSLAIEQPAQAWFNRRRRRIYGIPAPETHPKWLFSGYRRIGAP